ncbi:MAG: metallophosphoesterase, partial [Oscillospiraceae bacterium]|nr:metallophosphoesterase [Oscillospiraceae bacterium]
MRIGVISDTHGKLRPAAAEKLRDVDCILHAGDFDSPDILQALDQIAPVYGVRGNNDWGSWAQELPRIMQVRLDGVTFCVAHRRSDLPWNLTGVDVVICGHTHQYAAEWNRDQLWLNPGSCSYPRPYRAVPTMVLLTTGESKALTVEKVELSL